MSKSLDEIMTSYQSDKASWAHDYCPNYEHWFSSLRDQKLVLLELGIGGEDKEIGGASLKGWADYFPNSRICGIDIYPKGSLDTERISTFTGSQTDEKFLQNVLSMTGTPDIIIDDASHINTYTIKSFQILFPLLRKSGIYVIEDLSMACRWDFGGDINLEDIKLPTIMNYLFTMLHSLNPIEKVADEHYIRPEEFKDIESVHFYPDMVVIKKK